MLGSICLGFGFGFTGCQPNEFPEMQRDINNGRSRRAAVIVRPCTVHCPFRYVRSNGTPVTAAGDRVVGRSKHPCHLPEASLTLVSSVEPDHALQTRLPFANLPIDL